MPHPAGAVAAMRECAPPGASTQKGLPVRVGLLLELGAFMPFAELRAFCRRQAKLLAYRKTGITVLLSHGDKFVRNEFGLPQAGREAMQARDRPAQCHTPQGLWPAWESAVYYIAHPIPGVRRFAAS